MTAGDVMKECFGSWTKDWPAGVQKQIEKALELAIRGERNRCAKIARSESRRMCSDPESIQYRVGQAIAKKIESKATAEHIDVDLGTAGNLPAFFDDSGSASSDY